MKKVFTVLFVLISINVYAQWVSTNGPFGGEINIVYPVGTMLLAGCDTPPGGIYYSTNNGDLWLKKGLNSVTVRTIYYDGTNIYAGCDGGVRISADNGNSWYNSSNGISGKSVRSITKTGNIIYAGTNEEGLYKSTDQGATWVVETRFPLLSVKALLTNGNFVYAAVYQWGLFRSSNNGTSWDSISNGTGPNVSNISISGSRLYTSTNYDLFVSTNNGNNWTKILPSTNEVLYTIASSGTNILVGTAGGYLYRSTNYGLNWTTNPLNNWVTSICFGNGKTFLGAKNWGFYQNGVYSSTDIGLNWNRCGLHNQSLKYITANGNNIFTANGNQVHFSSNGGTVWNLVNNGISNRTIQCMTSGNNYVFIGAYAFGVYKSSNNGTSWIQSNSGMAYTNVEAIYHNGVTLFAGTDQTGVYKSSNNGDNWVQVNSGISNLNINCFAGNSSITLVGTNSGVFLTTNNGSNWTSAGMSGNIVYTIAVTGNTFLASSDFGLYRSSNNGLNWQPSGFTNLFVNTLFSYNNYVFAGLGGNGYGYGIHMTSNAGLNWVSKNQGFLFPPSALSITVLNNFIYTGTDTQSVWKRSIADIIGIVQISSEIPEYYFLSQNYPNPFNPSTKIRFSIPHNNGKPAGDIIKLIVFDMAGREVRTQVNEPVQPGTYEVTFDGSGLNSGVYFYRMITKGFAETRKMLLVK